MPKGTLTAELRQTIGDDATRILIERHGGGILYVPKTPYGHPLADLLGEDAARALCERFGGLRLVLPLSRQLAREFRDQAIRADRAAGMSVPQLARRHRLSIRQTYNVLGAGSATLHPEDSDPQQLQLRSL
jgi:hypothetical protein